MAKHRYGVDSNGPIAEATLYNIVFVDTSLDTHLVSIIPSSDTVSDFKKNILLQHSESFPQIGGVKIHSVQVKHQGHFYHLPDSMLVSSAFNGSKKTWFLFVEASCSEEDEKEQISHKLDYGSESRSLLHLQNHSQGNHHNVPVDDPLKLESEKVPQAVQASPRNFSGEVSKDIEMEVEHLQDDCQKELSSGIYKSLALPGATLEKNIGLLESVARSEADDSTENNKTTVVSGLDELPTAGKKHKIEHIENVVFTKKKQRKAQSKKDPLVDTVGKVPSDIRTRTIGGELNDTLSSDTHRMSISGVRKTSESGTNAEQSGKLEREEVDRESHSTTGEHVTKQEKVPSSSEVNEDNLVTGVASKKEKKKKKKKKKQKKILSAPHDQVATFEPNPILDGSFSQPNLDTEAPEANKNEGHVELVLNNDPRVMVSERSKPLDECEVDGTNEESVPSPNFMGASSPTEAVDSVRTKMKKTRTKKKAPASTGLGIKITGAISSTVEDLDPKDFINDKIVNDQSMLSLEESWKNNRVEKERVLSHNHDPQVQPSESFKPLDQVEAQEMKKGSTLSHNLSANEVAEAGNSGTVKRKKRKAKKSAAELQDKLDIDNLHETSLPAQDVDLDVEMNDEATEKNKTPPHIENELKNDGELSSRYKPEVVLPEGNKHLDSGNATTNDKESGFAEMSLDDKHGLEAGKSVRSQKKKRVKRPPTTNVDISPMEHSNPVNPSPSKHFEGDVGLSLKHGPEITPPKANKTLDLGQATVNCNESGFAAQLLDNENGVGAGKSGGGQKKKRAKKGANSVCDAPATHFASAPLGNQSILSCTEEKKKSKKEPRDASTLRDSKGNEASESKKIVIPFPETDQTWETAKDLNDNLREANNDQSVDTSALQDQSVKLQANEVQCLLHDEVDREQENAENINKKIKKTKRKQNKAADTESNSKAKGQNNSIGELAISGDKMGDRDHPYNTMNTGVSTETGTGNRSEVSELMVKKNAGVESKSSNPEEALKGVDSSEVPYYHTRENDLEERPETMMNIKNAVETSKTGDEGIDFRHYFVPEQHQDENASANKVKEASHSTEAKRKRTKPNFISDGTPKSNLQMHNMSNTNDNQLEESAADAKGNQDMPGSNKEILQSSRSAVKSAKSHDVGKEKTPRKATKPVVANGFGSSRNSPSWLEENKGSVATSSSSSSARHSKSAFQHATNKRQQSGFNNGGTSARKFSSKNGGDIVNSSQQQKSLLGAPRAIFDDSSDSSGDENGFGNSDASTRTPSDNSSSSGYSDSEGELSQDSRGNGAENAKMENGGCKSILNSKFPDPKDMSMDMILRSSKRFKKAKITASQSQEADTESQPVDFVPDSQAN